MTGLDQIQESMTEYLRQAGLDALSAYPARQRTRTDATAAAVSIRGFEGGPAGFRDYLGERYNAQQGRWEELYGRRMRITFGIDLYAGAEGGEALQKAFDTLAQALQQGGPAGLKPLELSAGEMAWDSAAGLLKYPAEAVCEAYLYAVADEGGAFLDFIVRGERTQ